MSEPKTEFIIGDDGSIVFRATDNAVLLTEEQAERIKQRIAELEERIRQNAIEISGLETMMIIKNAHIAEMKSLVLHMSRCMNETYADGNLVCLSCEKCPYDNDKGECDFTERMAELGIEEKK